MPLSVPRLKAALRRFLRRRHGASRYSMFDEETVAKRLLDRLGIRDGYAVDIAANDGVTSSNVLALYEDGWAGLAVEGDPQAFASLARDYRQLPRVGLARGWVTPETVCALLHAHGAPRDLAFLNLDIDGYDHFVLAALLREFRPLVICAEINENVPPPVRFTVKYDPAFAWRADHFYGQSICTLHDLATANGYALLELHYNNAFLAPAELGLPGLTPDEAYRAGYLEQPDRVRLFPWNADMEAVHELDPEEKVMFLREKFERYDGHYEIGL